MGEVDDRDFDEHYPDEIDFHFKDGSVIYEETFDISKEEWENGNPEHAAEHGVADYWQQVRDDNKIKATKSEIIKDEENRTITIRQEFEAEAIHALGGILSEISGMIIDEDPTYFAHKMLPFFNRMQKRMLEKGDLDPEDLEIVGEQE